MDSYNVKEYHKPNNSVTLPPIYNNNNSNNNSQGSLRFNNTKSIKFYKLNWIAKSKIGSFENFRHKPEASKPKIINNKLVWNCKSLVNSLPSGEGGGGTPKKHGPDRYNHDQALSKRLQWNATSKVGSLDNIDHKPNKSTVKISSQRLVWNGEPKVNSLQNVTHKPQGGHVHLNTRKLHWEGKSKCGTFDNMAHTPRGGNVRVIVVTPPRKQVTYIY